MGNKQIFSRHRAREEVLQALYSWMLTKNAPEEIIRFFFEDDTRLKMANTEYFVILLNHIISNIESLDKHLTSLLNVKRILDVDLIEKAILYIALDEILYQSTPYKVVINEAIELSKTYGNERSYKFINATLDKFIKAYSTEPEAWTTQRNI